MIYTFLAALLLSVTARDLFVEYELDKVYASTDDTCTGDITEIAEGDTSLDVLNQDFEFDGDCVLLDAIELATVAAAGIGGTAVAKKHVCTPVVHAGNGHKYNYYTDNECAEVIDLQEEVKALAEADATWEAAQITVNGEDY